MATPTTTTMAPGRGAPGFTLVELLIVIGILGVLAVAFLPDLISGKQAASETATRANFQRLVIGCETFERNGHGYYPPDDFVDPLHKLQLKADNGQNTGIESLVAFLSQSHADGADLASLGKLLVNTDKDDNGAVLPLLSTKERLEVADAWGVPLAYFSKTSQSGGFGKAQTVVGADGQPMTVTARKNADGMPFGNGKFQLQSAGKDGIFGTDDDLCWPER